MTLPVEGAGGGVEGGLAGGGEGGVADGGVVDEGVTTGAEGCSKTARFGLI